MRRHGTSGIWSEIPGFVGCFTNYSNCRTTASCQWVVVMKTSRPLNIRLDLENSSEYDAGKENPFSKGLCLFQHLLTDIWLSADSVTTSTLHPNMSSRSCLIRDDVEEALVTSISTRISKSLLACLPLAVEPNMRTLRAPCGVRSLRYLALISNQVFKFFLPPPCTASYPQSMATMFINCLYYRKGFSIRTPSMTWPWFRSSRGSGRLRSRC